MAAPKRQKGPTGTSKMKELTARAAAVEMLEQVLDRRRQLGEAFEAACQLLKDPRSQRDRAFVRQLGTTCLRHLGQIDEILEYRLKKGLPPAQRRLRHILRLAITQLLFMETPSHAAVNDAVEMTGKLGRTAGQGMTGLVNGVLRSIDREREALLERFGDPLYNIPEWLRESWLEQFDEELSRDIAEALLDEPPLDLTLKPGEDVEAWAKALEGQVLPGGSVRLLQARGRIEDMAGYEDGYWWVQDFAASLPVRLLAAPEGARVLDLCAAPGGKTAQSAALGHHVTAVDVSPKRLARLKSNLARLSLEADVVTSNAANYRPDQPFSYILLDAPCSTTGTLRRHPDVAWTKTQDDVDGVCEVQGRLLDAAVDMLAPGGVLVYCVCSLQDVEGLYQVEALLAETPEVKRKPVTAQEMTSLFGEGLEALVTEAGDVMTLPCYNPAADVPKGMDGFYMARLVKQQDKD